MILSTKSVAIAVIAVLLQCSLCKAVFQTTATHLTMGKTVATPYLTLFSYSDIKCVRKCFNERKQNRCSVAGYDKATETCFLSNDGQQELLDTADEAVGVFFYSGQDCVDTEPLINGNSPIPDDHMTASSEWIVDPFWTAPFARMSSSTGWCAEPAAYEVALPNFYIQVQFTTLSTIVAVQTAGYVGYMVEYITTYRLEFSKDCTTFDNASDTTFFSGNTDGTSIVTNILPTPVNALCVRLYPLTWEAYPDLKLGYLGCPVF